MGEIGQLGTQLQKQLRRAYEMLRAVIGNIPEEVWRVQPERGPLPAYVSGHVLEFQDCWTSGLTEEAFSWGEPLGPLRGAKPEDLPSKVEMLDYLSRVQEQTMAFVARSDADLLATIEGYDWADGTAFTLMLHGLRHMLHHQGQLSVVQWQYAPDAGETWR